MALDAQRNWTISMAENFEKVHLEAAQRKSKSSLNQESQLRKDDVLHEQDSDIAPYLGEPVYLPDEIIIQILDYVSYHRESQTTLASCCLLSRQWYNVAVPFLYEAPYLYGKNFDPFARAICPSINLHVRKSPLSKLVKILDMGSLVHQGSKSMTARLLGRTKENLEEFRAPQASFAVNCLPALAKCQRLRRLDLSLVSESPPLPDLFKTLSHLPNLKSFRLPRSSGFGVHYQASDLAWPPNLEQLALSGGIDAHFLHGVVAFPQTLRNISIEHCPLAKGFAVTHLIRTAIRPLRNLEYLKIANMPRLSSHALDDILMLLPQIKRLSISVDYITPAVFDEEHFNHLKEPLSAVPGADVFSMSDRFPHENLHTLELTNSGNPNVEDKISPIDIIIALDEGSFPKLRVVRVQRNLYWHSNNVAPDAEALADALQEASRKDWENREGVFANMDTLAYQKADWATVAGVWSFEG